MNEQKIKLKKQSILTGLVFGVFIIMCCYKLTNSALWFDEAVEYWYSKIIVGPIPFNGDNAVNTANMYERIISTFQPPLYNFVMFFWLIIDDSELWFRLAGVIFSLCGVVALFKTLNRTTNTYIACSAVLFVSFVFRFIYYTQECAEYSLMFCNLFWAVYFYVIGTMDTTPKNIIGMILFSILSVYSQYGAAFAVVPMAVIFFVNIIKQKESKTTITAIVAFSIAAISALFLYYFFVRIQVASMGSEPHAIVFENNIVYDFISSFKKIYKWLFMNNYSNASINASLIILTILSLISLFYGKSIATKKLFMVVFSSWVLFYLSVKANLYSYGQFAGGWATLGGRYSLFFYPIWLAYGFCMIYDSSEAIIALLSRIIRKSKLTFQSFILGLAVSLVLGYCLLSWKDSLASNWQKQPLIRESITKWYENQGPQSHTIVYYGADAGVAYYIRNNSNYNPSIENNLLYMDWLEYRSSKEYSDYFKEKFSGTWPDRLFLISMHKQSDYDTIVSSIEQNYDNKEVMISGGVDLICFMN